MCNRADKRHRAWQICSGSKHGRDFSRDSVGARVPETYQKCTKNGPKTYLMDITMTPKNIFEIKKSKFCRGFDIDTQWGEP